MRGPAPRTAFDARARHLAEHRGALDQAVARAAATVIRGTVRRERTRMRRITPAACGVKSPRVPRAPPCVAGPRSPVRYPRLTPGTGASRRTRGSTSDHQARGRQYRFDLYRYLLGALGKALLGLKVADRKNAWKSRLSPIPRATTARCMREPSNSFRVASSGQVAAPHNGGTISPTTEIDVPGPAAAEPSS